MYLTGVLLVVIINYPSSYFGGIYLRIAVQIAQYKEPYLHHTNHKISQIYIDSKIALSWVPQLKYRMNN